jgi:hypothetical protein
LDELGESWLACLDFEETVQPEAEEVGAGGGDGEAVFGPAGGVGVDGDVVLGEEAEELVTGGAEGVGAEGDGPGHGEGGGELGGRVAGELEEDVGQPVGDGGEITEVGQRRGRREVDVQQGQ